jgi:uncharacterized protein (DUF58 family)
MALFFTFAFSISSYFFGRKNIRSLRVELLSYQRVFALRQSSYTLSLSSLSQSDIYDITCISGDEKIHTGTIHADTPTILTFTHTEPLRGDARFESVQCDSGFPLPHQIFYKLFDIDRAFVVYPEPKGESLENFITKNRMLYGEKDDFEGIKMYESSDRISQIYWQSLAKGDSLMSKFFSYTDETARLQFDFLTCAHNDEARLSQLCLWVLACEQKSLPFSIAIDNKLLESKKMSIDEILTYLGRY